MDEHTNQGELVVVALRRTLALAPDEPVPATLTVDQAARLLRVGRGTAFEGARRGELPTIRLGRRVLIPTAKLLALLEGSVGSEDSDGDGSKERA